MVHEDITVGDPTRRRAPVILVELTDGYLEEVREEERKGEERATQTGGQ